MNRILTMAFVLFCLEIGIFLVVAPWSGLWENNFLLSYSPVLRALLLSNFTRGAVSGLGVIDVGIGLAEFFRFLLSFKVAVPPNE